MEELLRLATEVTVSHCCTMVGIYLSDWDIRQEGKSCCSPALAANLDKQNA